MAQARWTRIWRIGSLALVFGAALCLACGPSNTATTPKAVKDAKVVVIRLGGAADELEPSVEDIKDGLRQGGMVEGTNYTLENRTAEGDLARVATLVDEAVKGGADVLIALHSQTAPIVASHAGKIPVVAFISGDPAPLNLGEGVTGANLPFGRDDLMLAVPGCLPNAKRFGIIYNPDDAASAAHKDVLIAATPRGIAFETAEFHGESDAVEAANSLFKKGVDALILVTGMGSADASVIDAALQAKVPCFGFTPEQARAGAVMTRTPNPRWGGFEAGRKAARALAGESPGNSPFIQGASYLLYVNDKSLKDFNITIPGAILRGDVRRVGTDPAP